MTWSKPDFVEIILGMEATAYVNTDEKVIGVPVPKTKEDETAAASQSPDR